MTSNSDFAQAAGAPELTLDIAKQAVEKMYGQVRAAKPEDRLVKTMELMNSAEFMKVSEDLSWFAVDIAYACAENINNEILVSENFSDTFDNHPAVKNLSAIYPQAAEWYRKDVERLAERGEQHPNRLAWQHGWRTERKTFGELSDDLKHKRLVAHLDSDLLKSMSQTTPWSAADVIISLADTHVENGRDEFATQYLLKGPAFAAIKRDCPVLAKYYEERVAKFTPQQVIAPTPHLGTVDPR